MDPSLYVKNYHGQEMIYNKDSKVVILTLREKFNYAGKIFQWGKDHSLEGFGINTNIIQFILGTESKLLIHYQSAETKTEYWINHDSILKFIKSHNNKKHLQDTNVTLNNIPISLFKPKPTFSGDQHG